MFAPPRGSCQCTPCSHGGTSAHRADFIGSMIPPLLPPASLRTRPATSDRVPDTHIAAASVLLPVGGWVGNPKVRPAPHSPCVTVSPSGSALALRRRNLKSRKTNRLQRVRRVFGIPVPVPPKLKALKGPEPALVSLISLTMVVVVATAAAAVGSSEAPRGHLDSRSLRSLAGLQVARRRRDEEMTGDTGRVLARSLVSAFIRAAGHGSRK